jgi:hypothetical protein
MALSKILRPTGRFRTVEDSIPIHSREFNEMVDVVNAMDTSDDTDIALKANIASPTFTGTVTVPANGVTFTSNGTLVRSGAHALTLTTGGATNVTLPTSGTLATTGDYSALAPKANPTFTGTVTMGDLTFNGHKNAQLMIFNAFNCPAPGATEWTPSALGATLPASSTTKKMWIPLSGLKVGDEIVSYRIVGDVTEAATATLDCKLTTISKGDPLSVADVAGGGIVQVTADGVFDVEADLTADEVVSVDTGYALEVLGTTGIGDSITIGHVMVTINRK